MNTTQLVHTTVYKDSKAKLPYNLTPYEIEILEWVSKGKQYNEIADLLKSNERAIGQSMYRILNKLGACTNAGAVGIALRKKVII